MREDGVFIEAGENDNLIVQKLVSNPNAIGMFGYSFLDQNSDNFKALMLMVLLLILKICLVSMQFHDHSMSMLRRSYKN